MLSLLAVLLLLTSCSSFSSTASQHSNPQTEKTSAIKSVTENNIKNEPLPDFAISSKGTIDSYFKQMASDDFGKLKELITSASETKPASLPIYVYSEDKNGINETHITQDRRDVSKALETSDIVSIVIRVEVYKLFVSGDYDYSNIDDEAYIPMMLKLFSVDPNKPEKGGILLMTYPAAIMR